MKISWTTRCRCRIWQFLWRHSDHFGWLAVAGIVFACVSMAAQLPALAAASLGLVVISLTLALAGSEEQF